MRLIPTSISGAFLLEPERHGDARGWFSETFRADQLFKIGWRVPFVQDNVAFSANRGVLRGLHWQAPPRAQTKLIQVLDGEIFDVIVDIRRQSATFGKSFVTRLSAESGLQLFVPSGFAHGYCTLTENCRVSYKVSDYYAPEAEGGLMWNDPQLGVEWPIEIDEIILSERDRHWPAFTEFNSPFD